MSTNLEMSFGVRLIKACAYTAEAGTVLLLCIELQALPSRRPRTSPSNKLQILTQSTVGHSVIPRNLACCETTVTLPGFPVRNSSTADYSKNVFVVDDLTKHPELHARPYVTGYPHGRSYIGVPITTPDGINIGSYCVLDDKPRQGVSQTDLVFMRDMSQTVMSHLDTVRALSERTQRNRLVSGLGSFVRNTADAEPGRRNTDSPLLNMENELVNSVVHQSLPNALIGSTSNSVSHSATSAYFDQKDAFRQNHEPNALTHLVSSPIEDLVTPTTGIGGHVNLNHNPAGPVPKSTDDSTPGGAKVPAPVRSESIDMARATYQRAAESLCQSLDVDGVVFLDASVGVFGGLSDGLYLTGASSACESDGSVSTSDNSDHSSQGQPPQNTKICPVLGAAQTLCHEESASQPAADNITESLLRKLLRRYPTGKIWLYDEDGSSYSESEDSTNTVGDNHSSRAKHTETHGHRRERPLRSRKEDSETMQKLFPGARCIAMHGIYDHVRKRWIAGSLLWSYSPFRVLTSDVEMHFVQTFCDIIVAETRRLESVSSDKSKSDFISSISHELRSPLHGILGSAEMLTDLTLGATASTLVQQISACGNTLLEIVDHLLDFADLKKHKRLERVASEGQKTVRKSSLLTSPGLLNSSGATNMNANVTLDMATEDAVVSAAYSFYYSQDNEARNNVPIILDIDHLAATSWNSTLSIGGWKRVCLNLVINALKYTPTGFVRVELKQKLRPGHRRRFDAVMTVSDSGMGMSKKFQKESLFHEFSQEHTTSSGLGLGMHMVAIILNRMGGKIEVTSATDGSGTRVNVRVPLDSNRNSDELGADADSFSEAVAMSTACKGLTISLVANIPRYSTSCSDVVEDTASQMAIASIEKKCKFLGAKTQRCSWKPSASVDLRILAAADEEAFFQLMAADLQTEAGDKLAPTLVLCNSIPAARAMRDRWAENALNKSAVVEYTALPCSMEQLTRAIESVLKSQESFARPSKAASNEFSAPKDTNHTVGEDRPESLPAMDNPSNKQSVDAVTSSMADPNEPLATVVATTCPDVDAKVPIGTESMTTCATRPQTNDENGTMLPCEPITTSSLPFHPKGPPKSLKKPPSIPSSPTSGSHIRNGPKPSFVETLAYTSTPATETPVLLIVDDNPVNLRLLKMFAKKAGYPHLTSADGKQALDAYLSAHEASLLPPKSDSVGIPNVILMDINMPVMDGYESTQRIRHYENKHHLPPAMIIAVTALQSEAAHVEAFGSGFNVFLSKPVKLKQLSKTIQEWQEGGAVAGSQREESV